MIYTSSKAVFINSKDTELTGKTALRPTDEYGISKVCSEKIANFYSDVYDIKIFCFRMGEVCGLDLNKGMVNPFWKAVLNACVQKNPVSVYGKGEAKRDLIYVKDVVRALVSGLNNNNTGDFNISYGIYTNREIAEAFCKVFDNTEGLKFYPDKPEWGTNQHLILDKAARVLNFRAEYDLMNIVSDIHKEYRNER